MAEKEPNPFKTGTGDDGLHMRLSKIEVVDSPPVPEVYANNVQPIITTFDVTIHFGSLISVVGNTAKVARRVSIILSPEVAKMLAFQLQAGLKSYEEQVRPILTSLQPTLPNPAEIEKKQASATSQESKSE